MTKEVLQKHIGNIVIVCEKTGKTYLKVYQVLEREESNKTNKLNERK